tara:strand:+ start:802 stop:951 length:150 start_codon:yes stop_codon:yes gene_type:complete
LLIAIKHYKALSIKEKMHFLMFKFCHLVEAKGAKANFFDEGLYKVKKLA